MASTPTRDNADVNSIAFIKAFFEDFPCVIATKAADYTKIFENKGFDSKYPCSETLYHKATVLNKVFKQ